MMVEAAAIGATLLAGIGLFGLLTARNLVAILVSLQLAAKGVVLALVLAGVVSGAAGTRAEPRGYGHRHRHGHDSRRACAGRTGLAALRHSNT